MTLQGEHNEGNPFNNDAFMYGGIGKVKLAAGSQTKWIGKNTRFTKQFRGTSGNKTPFKLVVTTASGDKDHTVTKVISDTELHTATSDFAAMADYVPFSLGTPRGTGALKFGPATAEVVMPNSATREQLTIVCADTTCKFAQELKVGYWLVVLKSGEEPALSLIHI